MKKFLIIFVLAFTQQGFAQSQKSIAEKKIESVETTIIDDRKSDEVFKHTQINYDAHGNIIEQKEFNKAGLKMKWEK